VGVPDGESLTLRLMDRTQGLPDQILPRDAGPPDGVRPAPTLGGGMLCDATWVSASAHLP
jgi:hypothetical protein